MNKIEYNVDKGGDKYVYKTTVISFIYVIFTIFFYQYICYAKKLKY